MQRFKEHFIGITIIPEIPTLTLFEVGVFTADEIELLKKLGNKVYPKHPMGFGNCGLLVAYHFQCPNNNLPIVWANGVNNSYTNPDGEKVEGYPWTYLFEYIPKVKTETKKSKRSLAELNDVFKLAIIDRIGKNRRRVIRSVLSDLEILQPRDFDVIELIVRVWKQVYREARNRKEYFSALNKTQAAIDELVALAASEKELALSLELLAEFSIDFSQYSGMYADLNVMVSHLNHAIKELGQRIGVKSISDSNISTVSHYLCLRAKCRRALASLYKKRAERSTAVRKIIGSLRNQALHDAERALYPFSPPLDSRVTFMVSIETWNPRR